MRWIICIFVGMTMLWTGFVHAQQATPVSNKRAVPQDSYYQNYEAASNEIHTIRIESGKLWINGNLQKEKELPASLQKIDPDYLFEARLWGHNELKFSLFGKDYLLKNGHLVEMTTPVPVNRDYAPDVSDKENYYSSYKKQAPNLWQAWQIEAKLTLECQQLLVEYELAEGLEKKEVRRQLEKKMGLLFDLQVANEEEEIRQIENEIEALKEQLKFRKKNRDFIIENQLKQLTGE